MAQPVLVKAYSGKRSTVHTLSHNARAPALPPVSSYAFADILKSADSPEFQNAIDGIAEIAAKNRVSLADEYASHLPPFGEITMTTSSALRSRLLRPGAGMRMALASVPEASSGSSEGSRGSRKRGGFFGFRKQQAHESSKPMLRMRIGSMGRTIPVDTTTALSPEHGSLPGYARTWSHSTTIAYPSRTTSGAESSLQRLLTVNQVVEHG